MFIYIIYKIIPFNSQGISNIIGRDFFPDLPRLRANAEYIEAWENNDHAKLRHLQSKYAKDFNPEDSPSICYYKYLPINLCMSMV